MHATSLAPPPLVPSALPSSHSALVRLLVILPGVAAGMILNYSPPSKERRDVKLWFEDEVDEDRWRAACAGNWQRGQLGKVRKATRRCDPTQEPGPPALALFVNLASAPSCSKHGG